ncbi:KAP family P-loop NTPase fold protein [Bacillus cereus group sp. Bce005]|uniref:KAP family P-loop NTPase fold protein n=1 Tax=Bacillus cereus group sp. Bce005 TaxID=3445256 RepID=UPI003F2416F3
MKQSEDTLNRVQLASRIYDVIVGSSNDSTVRIGVCGKWGEGKTSLLYLIKEKAKNDNNLIVWFNPWVHSSDKELWTGFRNSFEQGITLSSKGALQPTMFRYLKNIFQRLIKSKSPKSIIGKWFDEIIKNPNTFEKDKLKYQIDNYIKTILPKNEKIIIFIDDLDRIEDSKLILQLLMGIKEILDFKKVTYVMGFDDTIISKVIEKELPTNSGKQFLEKIIDYAIYLPNPDSFEKVSYLEKELFHLEGKIKREIILDLIPYIPDNPRTIKRYIYNLSILNNTLKRFDEDELNWHFLYLGRLLIQEFPSVFQNVLQKRELLSIFSYDDILVERMKDLSTNNKEDVDNITKITAGINEPVDKQRLKVIVDGLRSYISNSLVKGDPLFYFRVLESPTLMTMKEFRKHLIEIGTSIKRIHRLSESNKQEYMLKILGTHDNLHSRIVDLKVREEMDSYRDELQNIDKQISDLIIRENILNTFNEIFLIDLFEKILAIANHWEHFNKEYYIEFRENEEKWLKVFLSLEEIPMLKIANVLYQHSFDENAGLRRELRQYFEPRLIENFFNKFKTEDIGPYLFGEKRTFLKLLLNKDGSFHSQENYSVLEQLVEEAKSNLIIRMNFYNLLLIILDDLDSVFESGDMRDLRGKIAFVKIIWLGFVSGRWNRRNIGSLEKKMSIIINILKENGEEFSYPEWWEEIKNTQ